MIARDKQLHFIGGAIIALALITWLGPWWSLAIVALIGAGKELLHDWLLGRGTVEFLDFVWTVAGWVPVAAAWWLWMKP